MKYKLKIINYKPYEYELFQETLDQLGQQNYYTDDLSLISIFKKEDHPVYYKIDFFNPVGKSRTDKNNSKDKFYDPYIDESYKPIYNKKGMYVFAGDHEIKDVIKWKEKTDFINEKRKSKYINTFMISLFVTIFFIIGSLYAMNIDTFLSYGITLLYIGAILACLTAIYRLFCNLFFSFQFSRLLKAQKHEMPQKKLRVLRKIYLVLGIVSSLLIVGGIIEDGTNPRSFTSQEHPYLTLSDLGITDTTKVSTQAKSSFTVPHFYSLLESGEGDNLLYIKEYQLHDEKQATKVMKDFQDQPDLYLCTSVTLKDNVLYGYYEDDITTLIIQNNNNVILVSYGFIPSQEQIQTTLSYYTKSAS